ncbi:unnamed protein product, partial [Prorocentrum cordatum]
QEQFGVDEHGEVLDRATFDAAVAALAAPAAAADREAATEPAKVLKLAVVEDSAARARRTPGAADGAAAASGAPGAPHGQPHLRPGLLGDSCAGASGCHGRGGSRIPELTPVELATLSLVIGLPLGMLILVVITRVIERRTRARAHFARRGGRRR